MARHELIEQLATPDEVPVLAIGGCLLDIDAVAPDLLAVVESAAAGTLDRPADEMLLFRALHVLAGARVERLHEPLMRLLRRPNDELEDLLGDAITETLGRIVVGGFDGNANDLFELLCEPERDQYMRSSVFGAVAFLTWAGRIDEHATRAFLERFDNERCVPDDDWTWFAWSEVVELLGWEDMSPRVEQAYRDGRIPKEVSELKNYRKGLAETRSATAGDDSRFQRQGYGYIRDVAEELLRFSVNDTANGKDPVGDFTPAPSPTPARNPFRDVGRNDPCPCGSGKKYKRCCLAA